MGSISWGKLFVGALVFGAGSAIGAVVGTMVYDKVKAKLA